MAASSSAARRSVLRLREVVAGPSRPILRGPATLTRPRLLIPHPETKAFLTSHRPLSSSTSLLARPLVLSHRPYASLATATTSSPPPTRPGRPNTVPTNDPDPNLDPESEPDLGPEPTSAYGRFKRLSKKYGWWAVGVYLALTVVDFSLTLGVVHSVGAERIEPVVHSLMHQYRVIRYGEEEAVKLDKEAREKEADDKAKEKVALEAMTPEERKKRSTSQWGSKTFWAEVVLAYTIHKTLLLPVRAGLTVAWTPRLVKWLTARGWVGKVRISL